MAFMTGGLALLLLFTTAVTSLLSHSTTTRRCCCHDAKNNFFPLALSSGTAQRDDDPDTAAVAAAAATFTWIDPLLMNALLATFSTTTTTNLTNNSYSYSSSNNTPTGSAIHHLPGFSYQAASHGLAIWRACLLKGRVPVIPQDFTTATSATADVTMMIWPPEPLYASIRQVMVDLQLPRFVHRHGEIVSIVLLLLIRLTAEFAEKLNQQQQIREPTSGSSSLDENDDDQDEFASGDLYPVMNQDSIHSIHSILDQNDDSSIHALANQLANVLVQEFGGVIRGVALLDQLFGYQHGLLNVQMQQALPSSLDNNNTQGFGLQDGIWQHTGWSVIPRLQRQVASMPELRDLLQELGQRPTAEQNDNKFHKFPPRQLHPDGSLGAQMDPQARNSVSGITFSSSLAEMLQSEAVLLRGSPHLRRLFFAKKAEAKLLSYQVSGWTDVPSIPVVAKSRLKRRMPSAPGGPIIVCLDTSWSMSTGIREELSKAVVLACVSAAHKQQRPCQVVAFSTERGIMETGVLTTDAAGIQRLLDFLSHSFGGGTDVTGALKHAIQTMGLDDRNETTTLTTTTSHRTSDIAMAGADILMVTDGEIPDPPISKELMEVLNRLKFQTGMEIHGLLVGKSESEPLAKICTKVHDFLSNYDDPFATKTTATVKVRNAPYRTRTALNGSQLSSLRHPWRRVWGAGIRNVLQPCAHRSPRSLVLYGVNYYNDEGPRDPGRRKRGRKSKWDEDDNNDDYVFHRGWNEDGDDNDLSASGNDSGEHSLSNISGDYVARAEEAVNSLRRVATERVKKDAWSPDDLDKEKNAEGSCWKLRGELQAATARVGEGLVEREEEARLVVLAMVAREHILLLGVPGTGKSLLGRRLSNLCGGKFFQRLLTRFTTPEEIFGPLSLRALENDEYRRCTEGFLPTASVAFLDEIFKANSAILNTLLTILNERKFDNGAGRQEDCLIDCVVGASNELPESDELDALYDRFLLRKEVLPVSDEGIMQMLAMSNPGFSPCDSEQSASERNCDVVFTEGLERVISELLIAIRHVTIGEEVASLIRDLRTFLREELNISVSDRRLVKAARLLKISAASHGRTRVDPIDCMLLQHVAWQLPEQRFAIREWLWDHITPCGGIGGESSVEQFRLFLDSLRDEALAVVRKTGGDISGRSGGRAAEIALVNSLRNEALRLVSVLQKKQIDILRHMELLKRAADHLWLDPNESESLRQMLLPRAENVAEDIERSLIDASALEMLLSSDPASPPDELRLSVLEELWKEGYQPDFKFTDEEMNMSMKEAKKKYDLVVFRKWKSARKRLQK